MKKTMCISDAALFIVILLGVANTIACTNTILDAMSDETKSAYKPVSTPASSSLITVHESLRLVFPRSMKGVKLTLGGTLGSFGTEALTWTQTNASQDTLLLNASCVPQWNAGDSRTLTINIKADGESADYSFTFDVIKAVCVADPNIAPSEADNGTMAHPLRSIQAGIDYASEHFISAGFGPVDVRVGGGDYSADCNANPAVYVVNLAEGVSLFGGYAPGFKSRDPLSSPSRIIDLDTDDETSSQDKPTHPVHAGAGISEATRIDGFTILSGSTTNAHHCALYCDAGSPSINQIIVQGPGSDRAIGLTTCGIRLNNSASRITNSTINPGEALFDAGEAYGLYINGSSTAFVDGCTISGGKALFTYGLFISKNEASDFCSSISTNTIDGGWWNKTDDGSGFVIVLNDQANPKINNNHFVLIKTGNIEMYGVAEYGTDADPKTLNNNYFDFTGNWYRDEGATTISTANWDIAEISTGEGSGKLFNSIWGNMK